MTEKFNMSNHYIINPDGSHWVARDEWDYYMYDRMYQGYTVETLTEEEYKKKYK